MAHVLIMPRQGNTVESCIICEWKISEGDIVGEETPVCSVETDKAAFEIPAGAAGTVLKILHNSGDDVPVLQPILVIGNKGENWEEFVKNFAPVSSGDTAQAAAASSAKTADANSVTAAPPKEQPVQSFSDTNNEKTISPRARKMAYDEAVDPRALTGSGPGGRIIERDVAEFISGRPPLSAAAKDEIRRRFDAGLPAGSGINGSGIGGRILAGDLEKGPTAGASAVNITDEFNDSPIKGIRKLIADQMMKSCTTTAPFTLNSGALANTLTTLRARFKASEPELGLNKITVNDLVLFAVSRTLPRYPNMNAHKIDGVYRTWKNIHLGVAVSTPRGLMVPVIRNADKMSLTDISRRAKELAEACRNGTVSPDNLHGSTFTVSNLGNTGIESFSPVINIPEVAILGVCAILPKPVETSPGKYEIVPHLGLSLTVDHAVVDGAPAAEFLKALCETIRDIDLWIIKDSV